VTPAQVLAAKLALELSEEAGEPPNEVLEAIANARAVPTQQSRPGQRASADEQTLATLERIERQLEVRGQERSQPSTQPKSRTTAEPSIEEPRIQDRTLRNVKPEYLENEGVHDLDPPNQWEPEGQPAEQDIDDPDEFRKPHINGPGAPGL
jgi:hypothetical protein